MAIVRPGPTAVAKTLSHLLLAGQNPLSPPAAYAARSGQQPSNPRLTEIPLSSWLGSIGRAQDVEDGWKILPGGLSSGLEHNLIAYSSEGVDRCFSVGRNEVGQLGIGYNSQGGTRGLVEGFKGDGILQTGASVQSSYMLLKGEESNVLYVFGSLQRGRLGLPSVYAPSERDDGDVEPELHVLAKATEVIVPPELGGIESIAVGFEHLLVLSTSGEIWGTGCNTDGQLGLGDGKVHDMYELTKMSLPAGVIADGGVASIRAGADTSALLTASGSLWTWGNSEYAQGLHGRKIDQVHIPTSIDSSFLPPSRRIVDFRCGGSFSLVLDDHGSVYSAGLGALGIGVKTLESTFVQRIDTLEGKGISRIRAGWGWAAAVRDDGNTSSIYTWGLNNIHGRLGVGTLPPSPSAAPSNNMLTLANLIHTPTKLILPLEGLELGTNAGDQAWEVGEVECGHEALWVGIVKQV